MRNCIEKKLNGYKGNMARINDANRLNVIHEVF